LLSSMTEFIFSTQTASTSPSNIIHLKASAAFGPVGFSFASLKVLLNNPSDHSLVYISMVP
jgi:hypothetical protein